jgi:hypothetical protein
MSVSQLKRGAGTVFLGVLLFGALGGCVSTAPSLPELKSRLTAYVESGAYEGELAEIVAGARRYLAGRIAQVERPAIVLDIDETSLSNWGYIREIDFGYSPGTWKEWVSERSAKPLQPTLDLYRYARRQGVAVFFISGRSEGGRPATEENLRRAGYDDWAGIYLRDPSDQAPSVVPYKSSSRRAIEQRGYTILLNLGDQQSDLDGGHAELALKLPNPFYFVP